MYRPIRWRHTYHDIENYAQPMKLQLGEDAAPPSGGLSPNTKMLLWGGGIGIAAVVVAIVMKRSMRKGRR